MNTIEKVKVLRERRTHRNRKKIRANNRGGRKRIYLNITNRYLTAQLIDDESGKTLLTVTTRSKDAKGKSVKNIEASKGLASQFADKLKEKSLQEEKYIFDRGARIYHGKVKAFADGLREKGLSL